MGMTVSNTNEPCSFTVANWCLKVSTSIRPQGKDIQYSNLEQAPTWCFAEMMFTAAPVPLLLGTFTGGGHVPSSGAIQSGDFPGLADEHFPCKLPLLHFQCQVVDTADDNHLIADLDQFIPEVEASHGV